MKPAGFERSVFVNCPFDDDFKGLQDAIIFCIRYLGLTPRIASESYDGGALRLQQIQDLIENCRYSIHDLSRIKSESADQYFRLNMPLELGLDLGARKYGNKQLQSKKMLVCVDSRFEFQKAISDLAGCDPIPHNNQYQKLIKNIRNWLVSERVAQGVAPNIIAGKYETSFLEWHQEKYARDRYTPEEIMDLPTNEMIASIDEWMAAGEPDSFN